MPVPQARILNPFVPRDDLGIEEDISNKLYLPSDVSLSLATMVGRNGRKPRIVQMDDDGSIYATFAPAIGGTRLENVLRLVDNQPFTTDTPLPLLDVSAYQMAILCVKVDDSSSLATDIHINFFPHLMDDTHTERVNGLTANKGQLSTIAFGPVWYQDSPFSIFTLEAVVSDAPATRNITLDLYHS